MKKPMEHKYPKRDSCLKILLQSTLQLNAVGFNPLYRFS